MGDRDDLVEKIRKCLALAASGNEHEAASALRQAQKLMEMHQVSDTEILAASVRESNAKSGATSRPSSWENYLALRVADAFGCKLIFQRSFYDLAHWIFIGLPPSSECASYAFEVLLRQALKARRDFISDALKRTKKKTNKTRRADLFSDGWVVTACAQVGALTPPDGAVEAIRAYMDLKYPRLRQLSVTDRNADRNLSDRDHDAYHAGSISGRGAQLNQGVGVNKPLMLGGA